MVVVAKGKRIERKKMKNRRENKNNKKQGKKEKICLN